MHPSTKLTLCAIGLIASILLIQYVSPIAIPLTLFGIYIGNQLPLWITTYKQLTKIKDNK